jgi:glycosyltransferase involved in cell wall biosynthesis
VNGGYADRPAPRVTVVIPTYNYAAVLPYSIGSVLDQTFEDFELLVVGDGCTDDSEPVVMATGDARVQWVNLPLNTGHQTGPNNEGLRRARGEVVAYLGHDDLWLPSHLEVLMGVLESGVPAAHTSVFYAEPGCPCSTGPKPDWSYARGDWVAPTSLAIRRSHAIEVRGWRDATQTGYLSPEGDFLARVYDIAGPPRWSPRVTCIKLTASKRRNVYRTRPTHEQAYWLAQIRAADDPERAIAAHIGRPHDVAGARAAPQAREVGGLHTRAWRSAKFRLRKRLRSPRRVTATARVRRDKRFKGLR